MKNNFFLSLVLFLFFAILANAQEAYFSDSTLRIDYTFSGDIKKQEISVSELRFSKGWYGRRLNMNCVHQKGNGQIIMKDAASGKVIYCQSFSTLFQEWLGTEEATRLRKSFENVYLLPMPKDSVIIDIELYNFRQDVIAKFSHVVNPHDILIRPSEYSGVPYTILHQGKWGKNNIDIAIVAEGYTEGEMDVFYEHAKETVEAIFSHAPFDKYKERFNIVAVGVPSKNSGVSIPGKYIWKETAVNSHFDTFYSDRYLTTLHLKQLHDILAGIPYEHIIMLANTENYGGGGIYNSYTLTSARHSTFRPVVVHEFGHSFAGLADEYYYDDQYVEYYYPDIEPWEQNITTLHDFSKKWKHLLRKGTEIPTQKSIKEGEVGVIEGAGYQSKGVFRGCENCRMKTNEARAFCPVCQDAIERLILYYTGK